MFERLNKLAAAIFNAVLQHLLFTLEMVVVVLLTVISLSNSISKHKFFVRCYYWWRWMCTTFGWWPRYTRWWPTWNTFFRFVIILLDCHHPVRLSAKEHSKEERNFNVFAQLHLCTYWTLMYMCGTHVGHVWFVYICVIPVVLTPNRCDIPRCHGCACDLLMRVRDLCAQATKS